MTKVVLKSLFRKPATERYPFAPRTYVARSRGSIAIDISVCIFCGMCSRKCPTSALGVSRTEKTWEINRLRCITCNYCVDVCPKKCLRMENTYTAPSKGKNVEIFHHA
jgi:formate hydrogenlyase subunit 6/NADH:ubiquinone oxidoreductase subunit I